MVRTKKNIAELTLCSVEQYKKMPKAYLSVMADNVRSLLNIGAIFRTADAFRVREFILAGITGTPPHPEISKTALGAEEAVDWRHIDNALSEVIRLQKEGVKICVLEQAHSSIPLQKFIPEKGVNYLLVVGNEVNGVNQQIVDVADYLLEIPQFGTKHSLNVAASAAIAIWQLSLPYISDISEF